MFYSANEIKPPVPLTYQQEVKEKNIKRIFDLLRSGECESRAELVRAMELSATSISALVEELQARKYLEESGLKYSTQPGRRPIRLKFNENSRHIVTFTVCRRGVQFTLLNLRCNVLESLFVAYTAAQNADMDAGPAYTQLFREILSTRSKLFDPARTLCVGIVIPGINCPNNQYFTMTSIGLRFSWRAMADFESQIGFPVYLVNTTICQAYAEKKFLDSAGDREKPVQDLIYIHVNDGVGASIVSNGDIIGGAFKNAGEIGHMTVDYCGHPCACGNHGCLERYVNLNAILDSAKAACAEAGFEAPASLAELAESRDRVPAVERTLKETAEYLARGIYNMICATGIQRIVLGGGVEVLGEAFIDDLRNATQSRSNLLCNDLNLSYARAGGNADGIGFAHGFLDEVYTITY